jgi:hypothetical protein
MSNVYRAVPAALERETAGLLDQILNLGAE